MCFNHLLVSALGIIFLAVALAPAVYRSVVRDEFHMALDQVHGSIERSYVSQRLWRMISGLRSASRVTSRLTQATSGGLTILPTTPMAKAIPRAMATA